MRKIRDILRLRHEGGLSIRQIRASTKVSVGAIQKLLSTADTLGLGWPLDPGLTDTQLAGLFYPRADTRVSSRFELPDWSLVHQELKRKGMTKLLLWEEYTEQYPNHGTDRVSRHGRDQAGAGVRGGAGCLQLHVCRSNADAILAQGDWINRDQNLLITGPCGSGKTYLACACTATVSAVIACLGCYRNSPRARPMVAITKNSGNWPELAY